MQKKLTITLDEQVYDGLYATVGRRHISQFIESVVRPHVTEQGLEEGYRQMAADEAREAEALEWAKATIGDVRGEVWWVNFDPSIGVEKPRVRNPWLRSAHR